VPNKDELSGATEPADAVMLCGWFDHAPGGPHPLLAKLPPLLLVSADRGRPDGLAPAVDLLAAEVRSARPGSDAVIGRLVEVLLVLAIRAWTDGRSNSATCPSLLTGLRDPVVANALQVLHDEPARAWTVEGLARRLSLSRATLARRFSAQLGEGPLAYLTRWRMTLAAQLLRETDTPVDAVARQVGYASPFAFSRAFSRIHNEAPTQFRRRVRR